MNQPQQKQKETRGFKQMPSRRNYGNETRKSSSTISLVEMANVKDLSIL